MTTIYRFHCISRPPLYICCIAGSRHNDYVNILFPQGRSRTIPRVLPSSRSSHERSPIHHSSYSHLNGHTDSTSSSKESSAGYDSLKKRLQPIGGGDTKPRSTEKTLNGISKRSGLMADSSTKGSSKQGLMKQTSQESKKNSSSLNSADQAINKDMESISTSQTVQSKLLPRLV